MKTIINRIFKFFGLKVSKYATFEVLSQQSNQSIFIEESNSKNDLLNNFFKLIKSKGFSPDTIYDIGANKGLWTIECMKHFPNSQYHLFEPQIVLEPFLTKVKEDANNINVHYVGVGNQTGEIAFTIHDRDDSCSFNFTEEQAKERGFKQILAPIVIFDDYIKENSLPKPTILKIDGEGLDIQILNGARKSISEAEVILVEVCVMSKQVEDSFLKTIKLLDELGYKVFDFTDLNRPHQSKALWLCEIAFIRKEGALDLDYKN